MKHHYLRRAILSLASLLAGVVALAVSMPQPRLCSAENGPGIDFIRDIQPLFAQHCLTCHGSKKQQAGLRLDVRRPQPQSPATLVRHAQLWHERQERAALDPQEDDRPIAGVRRGQLPRPPDAPFTTAAGPATQALDGTH